MQSERKMDQNHGHAGAEVPGVAPGSIQALVTQFHQTYKHATNEPVVQYGVDSRDSGDLLREFAKIMEGWVALLRGDQVAGFADDLGRQRVSLIAEELGELAEGCANGDPLEVFDAVCDLNYVVHGSAVVWGMPIDAGTREVHRSNMSKDIGEFKPIKGPRYSEPDLQPILDRPRTYTQLELPFPE